MIPGTPGGGDDRIFGFTMYIAPGYENIKGLYDSWQLSYLQILVTA